MDEDDHLQHVLFCIRCGYWNKKLPGAADYTAEDKAHQKRCDFFMMIRYINMKTGRITGGARPRGAA